MWRTWLVMIAGACALAAALAFTMVYYAVPTTLTVAIGPPKREDARQLQAIQGQLGRDRTPVRLRLVEVEGPVEAAAALDRGEVDLAVVRPDLAMPTAGQAIIVLRKSVTAVLAIPGARVKKIGDLAGRRVGVVGRQSYDLALLKMILQQYEIPTTSVRIVLVDPDDIGAAIQQEKLEVLVVSAPLAGRLMAEAVAAATRRGKPPAFIPIGAAEAIAKRLRHYEASEIVAGAFGGTPQKPAENVDTVAFSHYLIASNKLDEDAAAEFAKLLMSVRPALAKDHTNMAWMEAPSTDKDASVPVHPGAAAYFDGEQKTFFDRYGDYLFYGTLCLSVLGSAITAFFSYVGNGGSPGQAALVNHLIEAVRRARNAETVEQLDGLQHEIDNDVAIAVRELRRKKLDTSTWQAITLALDHARTAIADRRILLSARDQALPPARGPAPLKIAGPAVQHGHTGA